MLMANDSERALRQLAKAIAVAYELSRKLRKQAADSVQHATLLEQSLWQATSGLKRMERGGVAAPSTSGDSDTGEWVSVESVEHP